MLHVSGGVSEPGDRENVEVAAGIENDDIVAIVEAAQLVRSAGQFG
jgi:hypothetical protein